MAYRGKAAEDILYEEVAIWTCENESCNGWMRDDFSFAKVPVCHLCHSPMVSSKKLLAQLINTNKDMKSKKQGIQI